MARASRRNTKSRVISLDFSEAEERFRPPEGNYALEIVGADKGESDAGNDQLKLVFQIIGGKHDGKEFPQWYSLVDQALWKLAGVLRSAGMDIPAEAVELNLDEIIGLKLQGEIEHREWEGRKKAELVDTAPIDEDDEKPAKRGAKSKADDDEDDEKPARGSRRRAAKEEPEEDDEKPARRGSRRAAKDDDEDEKPARGSRRRAAKDDDDEKPARGAKKRGGKDKLEALAGEDVQDMDEEELADVVEKYELDLDLDDYKTLRKKAAAVIDALDAAGMLED